MYYLTLVILHEIRIFFLTFCVFLTDFRAQKKGEISFTEILPFLGF